MSYYVLTFPTWAACQPILLTIGAREIFLVQDVRPVLVSGGDIDGLIAFPNLLFNNISRLLNASDDVSPVII